MVDPSVVLNLIISFGALAGVASFIALVINVLKYFNIINDTAAPKWSAGLNLGILLIFIVLKIVFPLMDITFIDAQVAVYVNIGLLIFGYVLQLGMTKLANFAIKGVPVIGSSYTEGTTRNQLGNAK